MKTHGKTLAMPCKGQIMRGADYYRSPRLTSFVYQPGYDVPGIWLTGRVTGAWLTTQGPP